MIIKLNIVLVYVYKKYVYYVERISFKTTYKQKI